MEDFTQQEKEVIDIESDYLTYKINSCISSFLLECAKKDISDEIVFNCVINSLLSLNFSVIVNMTPDHMIPKTYSLIRDKLAKNIAEYLITAALSEDKEAMH